MKYTSPWNIDPSLGQRLIAWRREGVSFQDISTRLGMTRNSCIGWARRNGLANPTVSAPRDPAPPPPPEPEPMPPEPVPTAPVRLVDANPHQCRFPLWTDSDPGQFLVCGAPAVESRSWCSVHLRRVISPVGPRKALVA